MTLVAAVVAVAVAVVVVVVVVVVVAVAVAVAVAVGNQWGVWESDLKPCPHRARCRALWLTWRDTRAYR